MASKPLHLLLDGCLGVTKTNERGRFITFEGGEGSGKSTQAFLLSQKLLRIGKRVKLTREPGGTKFAECVRQFVLNSDTPEHSPLSEALLFFSARADHLETLIRPSLNNGTWIVCDRFTDSTRAYQGAANGLATETIAKLESIVVAATMPDLTIILDLPTDLALTRVAKRGLSSKENNVELLDRYESRHRCFHEQLRQDFLNITMEAPDRCVVIDASLNDPEIISQTVWHTVKTKLLF
ncbi:MAG: Thymidylate kinase [Hyphomicrobiaceae bacterium hypho_1]